MMRILLWGEYGARDAESRKLSPARCSHMPGGALCSLTWPVGRTTRCAPLEPVGRDRGPFIRCCIPRRVSGCRPGRHSSRGRMASSQPGALTAPLRTCPGRSPPPGLRCEPTGIPPDAADHGQYERPWYRRCPPPDRRLAVPRRSTMVHPRVGIPRFRGVFRLPHTPHIPPPYYRRSRLEILANNRIHPERLTPRESGVFPPEEGQRGSSSVPGGRFCRPTESAGNHGVMDSARVSSGPRNACLLTGHSSYAGDIAITSN